MTTALDVIKRSLRMLGVYSHGEALASEESQDGLSALNALMGSLSNEGLLVHAKTLDSIDLTAGQSSVTVGPSGATVTARPVRVLPESYILLSGISYPLEILNDEDYQAIHSKTDEGTPRGIWVQMAMPDITVTPWPVPNEACTLKLWSEKVITSFAGLTTELSLPPGYERMLAFLLAMDLAPEYSRPVPAVVATGAANARRAIKRTNTQVPILRLPAGIPRNAGAVDIRVDG